MPEARDRLARPNDAVSETYNRRRTSINTIGILPDNDDVETSINLTPFRWRATPLTSGGSGQRTGGRNQNTPPSANSFRRGRGGRTGPRSVLPSWYPRTPLGDITLIVRAMERRRGRLGDGVRHILGSPTPIRMHLSDAELEHELLFVTPKPKLGAKTFKQSAMGRVPLMLTAVANQCEGELELLTPQKKLLNSIEVVEKVVMEELHKLKRTPTAKKAEREKRVRTLMSMR